MRILFLWSIIFCYSEEYSAEFWFLLTCIVCLIYWSSFFVPNTFDAIDIMNYVIEIYLRRAMNFDCKNNSGP